MEITKEVLRNELDGLRQQLAQAQSQIDSIIGAMQTVEQLIGILERPEEKEEVDHESTV